MNRTTCFLAGIALFGTITALAVAEPSLEGTARVIDGDTLEINGQRVRLWGIDAFEAAQRCEETISSGTRSYGCGTAAWGAMIRLTEGKIVRCSQQDIDRYKRIVAQCFADKTDLGKELVLQGWAFDYTQYSKGFYKDVEDGAREAYHGAWAGSFQWPWDYRHSRAK